MSTLTKLDFATLDITGNNYLSWALDAEIHLDAKNLGSMIKIANEASLQDKAKAMIFLRHHLHEGLKTEYLTVKDPLTLWNDLKERYDHQKTVILPKARYDWMHLRLQDFKTLAEYNFTMFKITSQLKLCREKITDADMLEKTYSTFHASNMLLQQQYRERRFQKYSELISCLLVVEQNNELLMKNHGSRSTGTKPLPEANIVSFRGRGRGRSRGGRGQNRGRGSFRSRGGHNARNHYYMDHRKTEVRKIAKGKNLQNKRPHDYEDICYRCGIKGHWSRTYRTPKHLVELYQASIKTNGKKVEMNYTDHSTLKADTTHMDVSDFFEDSDIGGQKC